MKASTRCVVTGAEKGACVGAALVVLTGGLVLAAAVALSGTVDLGLFRAHFSDTGREFSVALDVSAALWAIPVLGALLGAARARSTA